MEIGFIELLAASLAGNLILTGIHMNSGGFSPLVSQVQYLIGQDTQEDRETSIYSHRRSLFQSLPMQENRIVFLGIDNIIKTVQYAKRSISANSPV
ncbi:MAG: hypothetical protein K0S39_1821 [Paenibacillus sp.]|nr:hypothetical protein [Paenibacillus sp.]